MPVMDLQLLEALGPVQFRAFLVKCFKEAGFTYDELEYSDEWRIHFILSDPLKQKTVVHIHDKSDRRVSRPTVKKVLSAQGHFSANQSMIISLMGLSDPAEAIAQQTNVIVWDREHIGDTFAQVHISEENPLPEDSTVRDLMPEPQKQQYDEVRPISEEELSESQVDAIREAEQLLADLDDHRRKSMLRNEYWTAYDYKAPISSNNIGPYNWQIDFHNRGSTYKERCLIAANRIGKTRCGSGEVSYHATGEYPPWWQGKRFQEAVRIWVGSDTNETSREIVQAALLGEPHGTGMLPGSSIIDIKYRQAGIADVVDTVTVRHSTGKASRIVFKTYEQGRRKWQGTSQHFVWLDEEPPEDIYTEAITRTLDVGGLTMMTFTPLQGSSSVVLHFMDGGEGITVLNATWDDAPHLTDDDKRQLIASFPEHEREARARGVPMTGSGLIYPTPDDDIAVEAFEIPSFFRRICGIDFGIDHPASAVWIAHDADADIIYVYDCYESSGHTASYHSECIKARGKWIPTSWPHDGMHRDKASGEILADSYRKRGVNMCPLSARYKNKTGGPVAIEPVVQDIDDRMRTGRFKVYSQLYKWFREKRMYHRNDGLIVKMHDDLMAATNYAVMMLRFAKPEGQEMARPSKAVGYNPLELANYTRV